ncbi:hypothetical protein J4206_05345 [Candidatus Woesearchaeota archaeon]|nr:hypothetical protein [Candidatus Woesearchaeota archaeon]
MRNNEQKFTDPVELINTFSQSLTPNLVDRVAKIIEKEERQWIDPWYFAPFEVGMHLLRYSTPDIFSKSCNYSAIPEAENSPENILKKLIQQYENKLMALKKIYQRGADKDSQDLVIVHQTLLDMAEEAFAVYRKMPATLDACKDFEYIKKKALCEQIVERLHDDVLPKIEAAANPVLKVGRYILNKISELGGPSIEVRLQGPNTFELYFGPASLN